MLCYVPNCNNEKVEPVPRITEIGKISNDKTSSNHADDTFGRVDRNENNPSWDKYENANQNLNHPQ